MRYRRSRPTTMDGAPSQQLSSQPVGATGYPTAAGGIPSATPWAYYQGGQKPASQVPMQGTSGISQPRQTAQQSNGWQGGYGAERPRSAAGNGAAAPGVVVSPMVNAGGSRPTSSAQPVAAAVAGGGQWAGSGAGSNALSYGSIRNRFMSGSSGNVASAPSNAAGTGSSSKLFSSAR
jgi:hypothetical protein